MNNYNEIRQQILDKQEKIQSMHNILMCVIPIIIMAIVVAVIISAISEYKQKKKEIEVKDLEKQILNIKYQVMAARLKAGSDVDSKDLEELEKTIERVKRNSSK